MAKRLLKLAEQLTLPLEAVTQSFAILAKRGAGKTYTASVLVEEMLAAEQQVVMIDPVGAWWGLRASADGRGPGFPIAVFGGEHGDLPLDEHAGELVATAIVEHRFSAVLDLSALRKGQVLRFMTPFAETLYRLNREPLHLVVDEADAMAPQGRSGYGVDENRLLGAMEDIVRRGRQRGLGCTLISQRPAVLNKNVLTQCESLFALRLVHPRDIDAIKEWINVHADPTEAKRLIESLPSLAIGDAWFWSPGWMGALKRIRVRPRQTFDSSATPKPGERKRAPKKLAAVDLQKLGTQIKEAADRAVADDPKQLKRRLAELERQLATKSEPPAAIDGRAIAAAVAERDRHWQGEIAKFAAAHRKLTGKLGRIHELSTPNGEARVRVNAPPTAQLEVSPRLASSSPETRAKNASKDAAAAGGACFDGDRRLTKAEHALLLACYWLKDEQPSKSKVAFYADYSAASSTFANAIGALRTAALVRGFTITEFGIAAVGAAPPKPRGAELRQWLRGKLSGAENAILDVLMASYPKRLDNDQIAAGSGYSAGSSTFANALGRLRTLEAAEGYPRDGGTKASDVFFE